MIDTWFKEAFSTQWIKSNIIDPTQDLVVLRDVIPWEKIIIRLSSFYSKDKGAVGKSLRVVIAILIVMKQLMKPKENFAKKLVRQLKDLSPLPKIFGDSDAVSTEGLQQLIK